jgi:cellulose synthase/poly-beta-1,6-N-acetylglucosamine synthase-like glycosyltransferase
VCAADPIIEPPMMVMNTVLSVMAYNYPPEKLSVYLSDDGGSQLTFYALLEAAEFAKHWIPYCKKYSVEPRSPAAYFVTTASDADDNQSQNQNQAGDLVLIKVIILHLIIITSHLVLICLVREESCKTRSMRSLLRNNN